jgi:recombinational DNA repair protein (RecF pathway)
MLRRRRCLAALLLAGPALLLTSCASEGSPYQYRKYIRQQGKKMGKHQQRIARERAVIPETEVSDSWNVTTELGSAPTP